MASLKLEQTKRSIEFNRILNAIITPNFNCKIEFTENAIADPLYAGVLLPLLLVIDGKRNDNKSIGYVDSVDIIIEHLLSKNKVKPMCKNMELMLIKLFLDALYQKDVLDEEQIQDIHYLTDNYDIRSNSFIGFIIYEKEEAPESVKAEYPTLTEIPLKQVKQIKQDDDSGITKSQSADFVLMKNKKIWTVLI
jgi:hypothetical protein